MFEINDVVSKRSVKISNVNITNTLIFFVEKKVRIFCSAKDSHIFSTQNSNVFDNVVGVLLNELTS